MYKDVEGLKIVKGRPPTVTEEINLLLEKGWELHGQLYMFEIDNNVIALQCVIKYKVRGGS